MDTLKYMIHTEYNCTTPKATLGGRGYVGVFHYSYQGARRTRHLVFEYMCMCFVHLYTMKTILTYTFTLYYMMGAVMQAQSHQESLTDRTFHCLHNPTNTSLPQVPAILFPYCYVRARVHQLFSPFRLGNAQPGV